MTDFPPHSEDCPPYCISGAQFKAAMEILGVWFDGNIHSVTLAGRSEDLPMFGHRTGWYVEVETTCPDIDSGPFRSQIVRMPMHYYDAPEEVQ